MKQLPADVVAQTQNSALWSKDEEALLANVPSVSIKDTEQNTITTIITWNVIPKLAKCEVLRHRVILYHNHDNFEN